MKRTKIEWTETTWNPFTGCSKLSIGCKYCYAETMAKRLQAMGIDKYKDGFKIRVHKDILNEPMNWKKPQLIFVNSMSDTFHEDISFNDIDKIMNTISKTPYHQYQILTKRAERMEEFFINRNIPENIWLGVTVESRETLFRINHLRNINAKIRFVSCEPLLEDLGLINLSKIDWIIVGGESGQSARPMKSEWVLNIQQQCNVGNKAFFFKQWGTWGSDGVKRSKKVNGNKLLGKIYCEQPSFA